MKSLTTTQQEIAWNTWKVATPVPCTTLDCKECEIDKAVMNTIIASTVTAVLDGVNAVVNELSEGADGSTHLFISKDALLKSLEEMEGKDVV